MQRPKDTLIKKCSHTSKPSRLLVVSCSATKVRFGHLAPAIKVYDGPVFRTIRKALNRKNLSKVRIVIISAKYGLISPNTHIAYYDQGLTKKRIQELRMKLLPLLNALLQRNDFSEILVCLGKCYLAAIDGFQDQISLGCKLTYAGGRIGKKLKLLKEWITNSVRD